MSLYAFFVGQNMKKYFLLSMVIFITIISGCPQNTPNVKTHPQPAYVLKETTLPQEEKPVVKELPESAEPNTPAEPNAKKIEIPTPAEALTEPKILKNPLLELNKKYAALLKQFVNEEGKVDYHQLRRKRLQLIKIQNILRNFDSEEYKTLTKEEKIAFWINAYNINLLMIIVENYPIESYRLLHVLPTWGPDSVRHINRRINGIENQKFYVMEEEFTLKLIEKRFFETEFNDPRIFLAVSYYATMGGPPLRNEPYNGKKLDNQLDDQAKKYISGEYGFKIDSDENIVYLSPLFTEKQFGEEFSKKYATEKKFKDQPPVIRAVLNFCTNYLQQNQIYFLETQVYNVKFMPLNWNLNEQ